MLYDEQTLAKCLDVLRGLPRCSSKRLIEQTIRDTFGFTKLHCTCCGEYKAIKFFPKRGSVARCLRCMTLAAKVKYWRDPVKHAAQARKRRLVKNPGIGKIQWRSLDA